MRAATALALLLSLEINPTLAQDVSTNADTSTELDVNFLTVSKQCSSIDGTKEWYICTQPDAWGGMFYCPAFSDYNKTELATVEWALIGEPTPLMPCFKCPAAGSTCNETATQVMTAAGIPSDLNSTLANYNVWDDAVYYCEELCEKNKEGESCSEDSQCTPGELFCDYDASDSDLTQGTCRMCPDDPELCYQEGFTATDQGKMNCRDYCYMGCYGAAASKLWIDGEALLSQPLDGGTQKSHLNASGLLHDCSDLILDPRNTCAGAEGKICLIHYEEQFAIIWQVSNQAENSGCAGVIAFIDGYAGPMSNSDSELLIPYVYVEMEEGMKLLNKIGSNASVVVDVFGGACYPPEGTGVQGICRSYWPCPDENFCEYNGIPAETGDLLKVEYTEGYCRPCPTDESGDPDPNACYFDNRKDGLFDVTTVSTKTVQKVQECADKCGAQLTSEGCKFCTSEVTGFEFGIENEDERCLLCPLYDVKYPDNLVPLFSEGGVPCWQLEAFFNRLPVKKDSRNCQLAQSMNYVSQRLFIVK
jgi:hypothetical protein